MADKIIRSLIYDDHPIPKKSKAWKERLKVPVWIALVLIFISGIVYRFANYREEGQVRQFMQAVQGGYYTKGMHDAKVVDSNSKGNAVVVYVSIDDRGPVALFVDKETLKISFSPINKYAQ